MFSVVNALVKVVPLLPTLGGEPVRTCQVHTEDVVLVQMITRVLPSRKPNAIRHPVTIN